jgi:hypothetical protein
VKGIRRALLIVVFYTGVAVLIMARPLAALPDQVPTVPDGSTSDYYHFHWNYWWIGHALARGLDVYRTEYIMAPFVSSLALHTLTPIGWPIWALIAPGFGTAAGMAAVEIALLALAGIVFYGFLRQQGADRGPALAGGLMLEVTPLMFTGIHWTNINIMGWFWIPLLLIVWGRIAALPLRRAGLWIVLLALAVWGMGLTDPQYFLFAPFIIVPYGLWTLARAGSWRARARLIAALTAAGALALALLIAVGPLDEILAFDTTTLALTPVDQAVAAIGFPECYIWHCDRGTSVGAIVLPLTLAALLYSVVRRPRRDPVRWLWLACVPAPLILSAGPTIAIGTTAIALPYVWLHEALGGMFRYPERFAPVFLIPAVTFAALTFSPGGRSTSGRARADVRGTAFVWALLIAGILLDARVFEPLPVAPLPPAYTMHARMADDPVTYVVVDVPTAGMSGQGLVGDARWPTTQFYGLTHHQRMVNGHISRVNTWHFMWLRDGDPLMSWLGVRRWLDVEAAAAQLAERIPLWPIGYFVVHENLIGRESPALTEIYGFFNAQRAQLCPPIVEGQAVFYRTVWLAQQPGIAPCPRRFPPDGRIDIGADTDRAYLGWGWYPPETFGGIAARWAGAIPLGGQTEPAPIQLFLDAPPGAAELILTAQSFHEPRRVTVRVNDRPIGTLTVQPEALADYTLPIPAGLAGDQTVITLDVDGALSPAALGQGNDSRRLALLVDRIVWHAADS